MSAMNKRYMGCLAIAVAIVGGTACATTINFDNLADQSIVTTQYSAQGVVFSGAEILSSATGSLNTVFPPHSGTQVVFDYSGGVITATAVGGDWTSVGGYITGNTSITEYAYDSHGNLVGTASTGGANYIGSGTGLNPNIFLSVSGPDIASVQFHDTGDSFTLDDFSFQQSVPDAGSTAILLLMGSSALVGLRRLKTAA